MINRTYLPARSRVRAETRRVELGRKSYEPLRDLSRKRPTSLRRLQWRRAVS